MTSQNTAVLETIGEYVISNTHFVSALQRDQVKQYFRFQSHKYNTPHGIESFELVLPLEKRIKTISAQLSSSKCKN